MIVFNFHRVEKPTGLEITRLSPSRFQQVLDCVAISGLVVGRGNENPLKIMPEILFTFDDGFASICDHALPELKERGWNAILFLIADAVGQDDQWDIRLLGRKRPMMSWGQAKQWSDAGFAFGSHSQSHADLTALSPRRLRDELVDSKARIEDELAREVRYVSYPFGRHNSRVREAVQAAGYDAAFAVNGPTGDRFAIPRVNVHTLMTLWELRRVLQGGAPSWRTRLFTSLSAGSATVGNWVNSAHRNSDIREPRVSSPGAIADGRESLAQTTGK